VAARRVRRLMLAGSVWAGVLVALALLVETRGSPSANHSRRVAPRSTNRLEWHLGHVVAVLAGRGALVRCWSQAGWTQQASRWKRRPGHGPLGPWRAYTWSNPVLTVNLSPALCAELARIAELRAPAWQDERPETLALAVGSLAHESMHVSGIRVEAKAECYGMQSLRTAAVLLGRRPDEARYLADLYARRWYVLWKPPYSAHECRNGGRLDRRPHADAWP
jgi:hypothetical protein